MSTEKSQAVVIRKVEFSETSRVVTLFTRDFGKISALAKGGRRLRGPFESALDLLAVCQVVFIRKSSSALDLLTEARLLRPFRPSGRDLFGYYGGYYVAELLHGLTEEYDPHPRLYDAAVETLERLGTGENARLAVVRFELVLLQECGLFPETDQCFECGGAVQRAGDAAYWLFSGGVLCHACHEKRPRGRRISLGTLAVMTRLARDDRRLRERLQVSSQQRQEMHEAFVGTICRTLGKRPASLRYLKF